MIWNWRRLITLVMSKISTWKSKHGFYERQCSIICHYWMKLYSNCCLQQGYAIELLNDGKPKAVLNDWPDTTGAPKVPQLLFEELTDKRQKNRSTNSFESDGVMLLKEMEENYIRGTRVHFNAPNVPEGDISLAK